MPKLAVAIAMAALSVTATPAIALPASSTVASRKESCIRLLQSNTHVDSAKDAADKGNSHEANHCLDLAEAHLLHLEAETQVKIERRDAKR